jgi:Fe-S-cluster containining protein
MNSNCIESEAENGGECRLDCAAMLPLCAAACCREWGINLTVEEYGSGQYDAKETLLPLEGTGGYQTFELNKGVDGACIYLDDDSQCRIYDRRPRVCRAYTCQGEQDSASVFPWQNL